jgi:hypothetical protein
MTKYFYILFSINARDTSVGIATDHGLEDRG